MAYNGIIPTLEVENMTESIRFYEEMLDFKCASRDEDDWALVQKDEVAIMLTARVHKEQIPETMFTGSLYVYSDNVDVLWQILKDKVKICYPIENFDYGMREFAIFDNNGYRLQFGQEIEIN